jgi:uncharacterized YceG family protein
MAEPPRVTRYGRSAVQRRIGALAGLLLGFGILAVIAWVVTARGDETAPPPPLAADTSAAVEKPTLKILFPEGFTREQMAKRIAAVNEIAEEERGIAPALSPRAYRRAANKAAKLPRGFKSAKAPHLEGFLFPATYEFDEDTTSKELVQLQLDAFERAWSKVDLAYARSKNLTAYDVLIIASMVEKEVQVPKERRLVAAVIYNRLNAGLPLGIDATIRYGLEIPPTQAIRQSELESDNPYNTRVFQGLPPTPIANPGVASLRAAARPASVDYLYYIRKADCKSHFFTASEQEFLDYPRAGLSC